MNNESSGGLNVRKVFAHERFYFDIYGALLTDKTENVCLQITYLKIFSLSEISTELGIFTSSCFMTCCVAVSKSCSNMKIKFRFWQPRSTKRKKTELFVNFYLIY